MEIALENIDGDLELYVLYFLSQHNDCLFNYALEAEDFAYQSHKKIFSFLESNIKNKLPTNSHVMQAFFKEMHEEGELPSDFRKIFFSAFSLLTFAESVQTLRNLRYKREIKDIFNLESKNLSRASKNAQEIKESTIEQLEQIKDLSSENRTVDLKTSLLSAFNSGKMNMIYTGYEELDQITSGFEEGAFIVLAARPAMGKSALAVNIALNLAKKGKPVLIFSLEMNHEQISRRIIACLGSIHLTKLKHGNLTSQWEAEAFDKAIKEAKDLPIKINDEGSMTLTKLRYEIKKFINKTKGKLVIVDYIQLIKHNVKGGSVERITEITNTLKAIAMDLKIVILGLSQLSRAVEQREDKRPQLSDLRESGSIEQDANIVMFVLRPEYYMEQQKPNDSDVSSLRQWNEEMNRLRGLAYVIVAKNRDGKTGDAKLKFDGEFSRFTEIN